MSEPNGEYDYYPNIIEEGVTFPGITIGYLGLIDGDRVTHLTTEDFQMEDPWSIAMRQAINKVNSDGWFAGHTMLELGIGDGRNVREAANGGKLAGIVGVDVDAYKIDVAEANLKSDSNTASLPRTYYEGDAVSVLEYLGMKQTAVPDRALMCLPQSNDGLQTSTADASDDFPAHAPFRPDWDHLGLRLNAGALTRLAEIASPQTETLVILSDRIPAEIHSLLFEQTGWQIESIVVHERVRQDFDTKLDWMSHLQDDGQRFFDETGLPLSIEEAVGRINAFDPLQNQAKLDVYHDVTVYRLKLNTDRLA